MYRVLRHGGNVNHSWRTVLETPDLERAFDRYNALLNEMRQGGVRLEENGQLLKENWAPRLRTRW